MMNKKINLKIFIGSTVVIGLLTILSLMSLVAEAEGAGIGMISKTLASLYVVLRFPFQTLLYGNMIFDPALEWINFWIGLVLNCLLYGIIIERIFSFVYKNQTKHLPK